MVKTERTFIYTMGGALLVAIIVAYAVYNKVSHIQEQERARRHIVAALDSGRDSAFVAIQLLEAYVEADVLGFDEPIFDSDSTCFVWAEKLPGGTSFGWRVIDWDSATAGDEHGR
jgi:hypothetical protein